MDFMVNIDIKKLPQPVRYGDRLLLMGSCFTEHIGNALAELKFDVLQNPNGILFDPVSVCNSLVSYIDNKPFTADQLFQLNGVWNSWAHHSRYSHTGREAAVKHINDTQQRAHDFLKKADWVIITLGSSFSYRLTDEAMLTAGFDRGEGVANCHRAPAQWFGKHLLQIDETITQLDTCYHRLKQFNPGINILFTISPVRHLRDGVVENNRSKARLIEAVHHMINKFDRLHYFPAYELVIDVLRDYRFYDIDLAHPNYMATEFVLEKFSQHCIDEKAWPLMQELKKIAIARRHRALQPETEAHRQFLQSYAAKTRLLQEKHSFLNLEEELAYFDQ